MLQIRADRGLRFRFHSSFPFSKMIAKVRLFAYLLIGCSGLVGGYLIHAQEAVRRFYPLPQDVELSNSTVLCLYADSKGFIWAGTQNGLNRFDGHQVKSYHWEKPDGMRVSYIHAIREDDRGNLWIATQEGIFRMDVDAGTFHDPFLEDSRPSDRFGNLATAIEIDEAGNLWLGSYQGLGIWNPDTGDYRFFEHDPSDPGSFPAEWQRIRCIRIHDAHTAWIGTTQGMLRFDRSMGTFETVDGTQLGLPSKDLGLVYHIGSDSIGNLWISTYSNGVIRFHPDTGESLHFPAEGSPLALGNPLAYGSIEDAQGRIWIASDNGLHVYKPQSGTLSRYAPEAGNTFSIGDSILSASPIIHDEILWLGTRYAGLWWTDLRESLFSPVSLRDSIDSNNPTVSAFAEDFNGRIHVTSDGGGLTVFCPQSESFTAFRENDPPYHLPSDKTLSIAIDRKKRIWIGTWMEGLVRFDPSTGESHLYRNDPDDPYSLNDNSVFHILETKNGEIWIATWANGICRYDEANDQFIRYTHTPGDPSTITESPISYLFEDSSGFIWISSEVAGLDRLNPTTGKIEHYTHTPDRPSLNTNSLNCVWENKQGLIMIGSNGGGINVYDPMQNSFVNHPISRNLPGNSVYGFQDDDSGAIWISTNRGLARYDPANQSTTHFGLLDGIHDPRFGRWACLRLSDGDLLFGGINGFTRVRPRHYTNETSLPVPLITCVSYRNPDDQQRHHPAMLNSLPPDHPNTILPSRVTNMQFEFTAPWYRQNKQLNFEYRLSGVDGDWIASGPLRIAYYRNLRPGSYKFEVRVANKDGIWNPESTSFGFSIRVPFWQKWQGRLLAIAIVCALLLIIVQWRIFRYRHHQLQLELKILDRTRELDSSNRLLTAKQREIEEQNQSLIQLNQTKDRLFSIFAHDIKNPFNSVLGFSELLHNKWDNLGEKEKREYIEFIHITSRAIFELLENLLYWSVSQRGRLPFHPAPIQVHHVVRPAFEIYRSIACQKSITITRSEQHDSLQFIADPQLLTMAIRNLINNAIKFTPPGGHISIGVTPSENELEFCVADNGSGISPDISRSLFTGNDSNPTKPSGTGIGLILCRDIVEIHGGEIWMDPSYTDGCCIRFSIPVKPPESGASLDRDSK